MSFYDRMITKFKTEDFTFEIIALLLLAIYIITYFNGKKQNQIIVQDFINFIRTQINTQFEHFGVTTKSNTSLIEEVSCSEFTFYASGRVNCKYLLGTMDLKKRQDIITNFFLDIIWPQKDLIYFDIPIEPVVQQPIVFSCLLQKELKTAKENITEFKYFCQKYNCDGLDEKFVVLAENDETVKFLLDKNVKNVINKYSNIVNRIFITDQKTIINHPFTLRFILNLPHNYGKLYTQEDFSMLIQLMMHLVDKISTFKLNALNKQNADNERAHADEIRSKENKQKRLEELEKKKIEKKKMENEKLTSLDPKLQRKIEEKEHQKSLKKKIPRQKILKM